MVPRVITIIGVNLVRIVTTGDVRTRTALKIGEPVDLKEPSA